VAVLLPCRGCELRQLLTQMPCAHCVELQHEAPVEAEGAATAAASGAWDVAMLARGGPAVHPAAEHGCVLAELAAAIAGDDGAPTAAALPAALPEAPVLEATAAAGAVEAAAAAQAAVGEAAPAAFGDQGIAVLQSRRAAQPYNPLKAAAEQAAAARQREAGVGWRQLHRRADMLALWHEYAAELGIGAEQALGQQAQQGPALGQPASAAWPSDGTLSMAGLPAAPAVGLAVPDGQQLQLWRVGQQHPAAAESTPPPVATPPPPPSASAGSDGSSSSGGATPTTDSCLTDSSCATSLGVAGRCVFDVDAACAALIKGKEWPLAGNIVWVKGTVLTDLVAAVQAQGAGAALPPAAAPAGAGSGRTPLAGAI
jgi:hypothetical protein